MTALEVQDVDVYYGRVHALRRLSFTVGEGEIVCLLGNNGAGKSTTMNLLSGLVRPKAGSVRWNGTDLATAKPWNIVSSGLIHVPEGRRIFSTMTVHENLLLGGYSVRDKRRIDERIAHVYELMPRLAERRRQQGGTLSGGEQQMVAIGRALIGGPRLLLLDEPSMGLAPLVVKQVMEVVSAVNAQGTTVLLVEQNARAALKIAHRAYVIETGAVTLSGSANELARDPRVVEAYLGA
ncbi:branched-chain amino acid transport system ATP-binding protein [Agromyces flavus]|uniref:Branched-chain amino acid transport system ATP-binding protein n=1 Tax=Agromyces flavus TaxID=589382 RepID=A0A1H1PW00_9MICO|nr:ABC transporter ATP-binding protein [Agromyces flavus]MCP2367846.1 branched-chain amino acid transport system ATP-binding protein [Agromyces flavus]GGI47306.1 ABC transporter ATP-binding protein [Agromyces flavus]SDS15531.1 branched-chain amino acid transport system ATP-binding protein [Agromyces flavus]